MDELRRREDERKRLERDILYSRVPAAQAMYYYLRQLTEESSQYPNLTATLAKPGVLFRRLSAIEQETRAYQMHFLPPALSYRKQAQIQPAQRLDDPTNWPVQDYQLAEAQPTIGQLYARTFDKKLTIDSLPFPVWGIIDGPEPPRNVVVRLGDEILRHIRENRTEQNAYFDYHHILRILAQLRLDQSALKSTAGALHSVLGSIGSSELLSARARKALAASNVAASNNSSTPSNQSPEMTPPRSVSTTQSVDVLAELGTPAGSRKLKAARAYAIWLDRHLKQLGLPLLFDAPSCLLPPPQCSSGKVKQTNGASGESGLTGAHVSASAPLEGSGELSASQAQGGDDAKEIQSNDGQSETVTNSNGNATPGRSTGNANPQANIQAIAKRIQGLLEAADWESFYLCLPSSLSSRMSVSAFSAAMSRLGEIISATYAINSIDAQQPLQLDYILAKIAERDAHNSANTISEGETALNPNIAKMTDEEIDNAVFELSPKHFPDQALLRPQVHESSWEVVFTIESKVLLERLTSRMVIHVPKSADAPPPPVQAGQHGVALSQSAPSPVTGFGFPILINAVPMPDLDSAHIVNGQTSSMDANIPRFALVPALNETVVGHRRYTFTAPAGRPFVVGCVLPPLEGTYTLGSFSVTCSNPAYQSITLPDLNPHAPAGSGICALYCVGPCDVVVELEYVSAPAKLVWATPNRIAELGGYAEDPELTLTPPASTNADAHVFASLSPTQLTMLGESGEAVTGTRTPEEWSARASAAQMTPLISSTRPSMRGATPAPKSPVPPHKLWSQALQFSDTYDHLRPLPGQDGTSFQSWLSACPSSAVRSRLTSVKSSSPGSDAATTTSAPPGHSRTFTFGKLSSKTADQDSLDGQLCVLIGYELYNYMVQTLYLLPTEETLSNVSRVLSREPAAQSPTVPAKVGIAGKIGASASDLCDIYVAALRALKIPTRYVRCLGGSFVQFLAIGEGLGWVTVDVPILQPLLFGSVHSSEPRVCVSKSPLIDASRLLADSAASRSQADEILSAAELFATLLHDSAASNPREAVYELFAPEVLRQPAHVSNLISLFTKISKLGPFPQNRRYIRVSANCARTAIYQETSRPGGGSVRWLLAWKGHRIIDVKVALCGAVSNAETVPQTFLFTKPEDMTLTSDGTQLVVSSWASETQELNTWRDKLAEVGARYNWEALIVSSGPAGAGSAGSPFAVASPTSTPRYPAPATPSSRMASDAGAVKMRVPPQPLLPVVVESGGLFAWPAGTQQQLVSAASLLPADSLATGQSDPETPADISSPRNTSDDILRAAELELEAAPNWTTEDVATNPGVITKLPACALRYHIAL